MDNPTFETIDDARRWFIRQWHGLNGAMPTGAQVDAWLSRFVEIRAREGMPLRESQPNINPVQIDTAPQPAASGADDREGVCYCGHDHREHGPLIGECRVDGCECGVFDEPDGYAYRDLTARVAALTAEREALQADAERWEPVRALARKLAELDKVSGFYARDRRKTLKPRLVDAAKAIVAPMPEAPADADQT